MKVLNLYKYLLVPIAFLLCIGIALRHLVIVQFRAIFQTSSIIIYYMGHKKCLSESAFVSG